MYFYPPQTDPLNTPSPITGPMPPDNHLRSGADHLLQAKLQAITGHLITCYGKSRRALISRFASSRNRYNAAGRPFVGRSCPVGSIIGGS
jgi:hypothetical protein